MNILQYMLDAARMDKTSWYKRKFVSVPRVNFNAKYPQRHQGAKECARRQRQKDRAEAKETERLLHEPILYGWREGAAHYYCQDFTQTTVIDDEADLTKMNKDALVAYAGELRQMVPTTIFREDRPQKNDLHPTMKPIGLVARMIKNSSKVGENVLDVFGGSGTTLMAAEQTGRNAFLSELDPKYVDVIKLRWEQFTGNTARKETE